VGEVPALQKPVGDGAPRRLRIRGDTWGAVGLAFQPAQQNFAPEVQSTADQHDQLGGDEPGEKQKTHIAPANAAGERVAEFALEIMHEADRGHQQCDDQSPGHGQHQQ
jgi:hypothetical protein